MLIDFKLFLHGYNISLEYAHTSLVRDGEFFFPVPGQSPVTCIRP